MTTEINETDSPPLAEPMAEKPVESTGAAPVATPSPVDPQAVNALAVNPEIPASTNEPWYLTGDVKGEGPRPEYLQDKYNNMEEQAKAYPELQAKFGAHSGAPPQYEMDFLKECPLPVDPHDPLITAWIEVCKKNETNQQGFEDSVNAYVNARKRDYPNPAEEVKKMDPHSQEEVNIIRQWAVNTLDADKTADLLSFLTTASRVELFQDIRAFSQPAVLPSQSIGVNAPRVMSVKDLQKELGSEGNYDKYNKNEAYRRDWDERLAIAQAIAPKQSII